jgi:sugar/nucleoside kinase (ribokinase family)
MLMNSLATLEPVDYLLIGHITQDITPTGLRLGGTASYASLTAKAFGIRVGIVTSCRDDLPLSELDGIHILRKSADHNTTFENIPTPYGRVQYCRAQAEKITFDDIPAAWRHAPIIHLGPIANELDPALSESFPRSMLDVTPQGWLRQWDEKGLVSFFNWQGIDRILKNTNVAILSIEDICGDEDLIQEYAGLVPVLVVTEGARGARIYWNNDVRFVRPPLEEEIDSVGAGDIFAASFFVRYHQTRDPWEAARVATQLAARSVTRKTLAGIPTADEVRITLQEILN